MFKNSLIVYLPSIMEIKIFKWSDKNSFYRLFVNRTLSPFAIYFIKTIVY